MSVQKNLPKLYDVSTHIMNQKQVGAAPDIMSLSVVLPHELLGWMCKEFPADSTTKSLADTPKQVFNNFARVSKHKMA